MASEHSKEDELAGTEQPFVAHLVELRDRLIKAAIAVGIAIAILALYPGPAALYDILAQPLVSALPKGATLIATSVISPFMVPLKIMMVAAFLLSSQWPLSTSGPLGGPVSADEYVRAFLHEGGGEFRDQTSSLSERLLDYELDWAMNTPWTVDLSVGGDDNEALGEEPAPEMPNQDTWNDPDRIQ